MPECSLLANHSKGVIHTSGTRDSTAIQLSLNNASQYLCISRYYSTIAAKILKRKVGMIYAVQSSWRIARAESIVSVIYLLNNFGDLVIICGFRFWGGPVE